MAVQRVTVPFPSGSNRKRDHRNVRVKKPDCKVAYVQLVSQRPAASSPTAAALAGGAPGAQAALSERAPSPPEACSQETRSP